MRSWIALSALALGACTAETSSPATPDHLEVVQAPAVGTPGRVLDSLILVRMVSDQGRPIAGATLSWSIIDGGGTVTPVQATTGEDGIVAATWRLGVSTGTQSLNVSATGVPSLHVEVEAEGFRAVAIAASGGATCALDSLGAVWCWGGHPYYQPTTILYGRTAKMIDSGHVFRKIVAGMDHFCALTEAGAAWCWGIGYRGELGTGAAVPATMVPLPVTGAHTFATITAVDYATCALDLGGQAWCWGSPGDGSLGTGGASQFSPAPVQQGTTVFSSISLGYEHLCALEPNGQAWCWGHQDVGQLGDSSFTGTSTPRRVAGSTRFREITAGDHFTCAVALDRSTWCWGAPPFVPYAQRPTPASMGVSGFDRLFGDTEFLVGIRSGRPSAAGSTTFNGLPNELDAGALTEIPGGLYAITQITLRWANICMLRSDGLVFCVGDVPSDGPSATPVALPAP